LPVALPGVEHLKCALLGYTLPLFANIRLGWKGLPEANILAFKEHYKITFIKSFITLALGLIKNVTSAIFRCL